ncbi:MAG: patatin-like phospholipase family protein [Magnetococcales bacterium]|nr:patatin-like phospholipase family protein [Magnetococcales bacterium]
MVTTITPGARKEKPRIALVLQGGGALGAYHMGVYQAMSEAGLLPDWVSGISIGALTAGLIVGNSPQERMLRLEQFWQEISIPDDWGALFQGEARRMFNQMSLLRTMMFGQPNFWFNRPLNPTFLPFVPPDMASICDTSPMLATLNRLVNFDLLNRGTVRLSLGVTHVRSGELLFFDNTSQPSGKPIRADHILASGSLPPGFPPIRIDGELYWDGGCVANTPVEVIFHERKNRPDLLVLVELYNLEGQEPTSMEAVKQRVKSIRYGDRTLSHLKHIVSDHNLRTHLRDACDRLPKGQVTKAMQKAVEEHIPRGMDILHLVYHAEPEQVTGSEAEFSRPSITERRQAGYKDMRRLLEKDPVEVGRELRHHPDEIVVHCSRQGNITCHRFI